jgi:hypothetical protein
VAGNQLFYVYWLDWKFRMKERYGWILIRYPGMRPHSEVTVGGSDLYFRKETSSPISPQRKISHSLSAGPMGIPRRRPAKGLTSFSNVFNFSPMRKNAQRNFQADNANESPSHGPSDITRKSFCSMNPPQPWTPK